MQKSRPASRPVAAKSRWVQVLFTPVSLAPLVYFRLVFGAIMVWEVGRYLSKGWVQRYFIFPIYHFTFPGFNWVQPWPGDGMFWHFYALGLLACCLVLGAWYRLSAALFFLGFTYVFLLEQARYLNHFYLVVLVSFLMVFLPAHRGLSVDAWRRPALRATTAPAWTLWLLRFQIGLVYVFGGLAKINADWLRGEPMRTWLARRTDFPVIGEWFTHEAAAYVFSYGGLLLDLFIVPLLLWRRTRVVAVVMAVVFHLTNVELFTIGIFPWFMIAALPLFFPPDWRGWRWLAHRLHSGKPQQARAPSAVLPPPKARRLLVAGLGVYVAVQLLLPFRHHLYPGEVSWTEEGHNFSWHMKLRTKSGTVRFFAIDPATGEQWEIDSAAYLTGWQERKMSTRPLMIWQFSHFLAEEMQRQGRGDVEMKVQARISLNGRARQDLIDPTVDLAAQPYSFLHTLAPSPWVVPLHEPLRRR